jgi:hypothetical protein
VDADGKPDWDCASIVSEACAVLFANDLAYVPDPEDNTFHFGEPRDFSHAYRLPHWLRQPTDVFRVDADGVHDVQWSAEPGGVRIHHRCSRDAVFVATKLAGLRASIEDRRQAAMRVENLHQVEIEELKAALEERRNE